MYRCNSHTWEIEFTNFEWEVGSVFIDRANKLTRIEIRFGINSRDIFTDISIDDAQKALTYAKSVLADEVITEQDPQTISVSSNTINEKYAAWLAKGQEYIIEFNAMSEGLNRGQSKQILNHLEPVLNALVGGALGAAVQEIADLPNSPLFPQSSKDFWTNKIETYLSQWN